MESGQAVLSETSEQETDDRPRCATMCAPLEHGGDIQGFVLLEAPLGAAGYDQDGLALLAGLAAHAGLAIDHARMHSSMQEDELFRQHMRSASRIQRSFLPESPPCIEGYEFAHWYETALEVGGDFYVFAEAPGGRIVTAMGDVSGRGIPAALLMAKLTTDIRLGTAIGEDPAGIIGRINSVILAASPETFVTCLVLDLDCSTGEVTVAGAGHPRPLLRGVDGTVDEVDLTRSLPVGIAEHCVPAETTLTLGEGDKLCLYTDGVTEAKDSEGKRFGRERLMQVVSQASRRAADIGNRVVQELDTHLGQMPQNDDVSFVCFGPE
jgi:serine phosphatase RsbU (regulator of sigma subunit)